MRVASWGGMETEVWRRDQPGFSSDIRSCLLDADSQEPLKRLVVGNLRSYGDQVLCPAGLCIQTTRCDRVLAIDAAAGKVIVESGITIDSLQRRLDPLGLMLPVTPGTSLLTVGGAIANDIHGKNHHVAGTFGCYVDWLELVRTSGEVLRCSESQNAGLFSATIGGMGLTGAITLTCLKVRPVDSPYLDVEAQKFANLDQFFEIDDANQNGYEYAVAWIDCLATGRALGRGVYSKANSVSLPMPPRSAPLIAPTPSGKCAVHFALVAGQSADIVVDEYRLLERSLDRQASAALQAMAVSTGLHSSVESVVRKTRLSAISMRRAS